MSALSHQYLVRQHNRRMEIERKGAQYERKWQTQAVPFFYAAGMVATLWIIGAQAVEEYRGTRRDAAVVSATLARCANGEAVSFGDDAVLKCVVQQRVASK